MKIILSQIATDIPVFFQGANGVSFAPNLKE